jgi:hypothetical protein
MKREILLTWVFIFISINLLFGSTGKDIKKGNEYYHQKNYRKALEYYEKAAVSNPESPYIYFNKGTALFKDKKFLKAKEQFQQSASKTRDLNLEAKANYNAGNCTFMEGERHKGSDLEKAINLYRESIVFYKRSLQFDETLEEAAHNIEVTRLIVRDLLDKLKQQQEKNKEQMEKQKKIIEKLQKIARDENRILSYTKDLAKEKKEKGITNLLKQNLKTMVKDQQATLEETKSASQDISEMSQQISKNQQPAPGSPLEKAKKHVDNAANFEDLAINNLKKRDPDAASVNEKDALDEIIKAIKELTNPDQQQGSQQKKEQPQDQKSKDQQDKKEKEKEQKQKQKAASIIEDEKAKKKKRDKDKRAQARYYAPKKDW